ncbi:ABC transporter permease [Paucisalibacillus sp. EB02]|uniref:ABC transporter permease n=1 Tax=Paucisalibacillus sp. EB02 TaxID=1347087 RepID=UPI0005A7FF63|nr:ABC transporter permease [Paucisalibacillus sp. EB02]
MIWQIIKKQGLLFWRNPQQLLLLVALPIILIAILGAALGSDFENESSPIKMKVAFMENVGEQEQIDQFITDLHEKLPSKAVKEIESNIENMAPINSIKAVFESEEVSDFLEITYIEPSEKNKIVEDDSYSAIVEVPESFSYDVLDFMVLGNTEAPTLTVTYNEEQQVRTSIVSSFLTQFQEQLTKGAFLGKNGIDVSTINFQEIKGEVISINEKKPVSASAYYTIGMTVMNVLFLAGAIGYYAYHEKELNVFNRIIMANVSRWVYFSGVLASGTIFAFIQSLIIFTFSWLVYGIRFPNVIDFLVVTLSFSFAIGGLAVLLSALNYRLNSETITNFFMNIIATLLAVLGGSFYPIGDFSPLIQSLGNMTPNGAGLTAYITLLRGDGIAGIVDSVMYLLIFALMTVVVAALCFPKRGVSA